MKLNESVRKAFRPALSYDEFSKTKSFSGLDGIRAIAVALVLTIHYGGPNWAWLSGWLGVQIFFVLSGFLITTLLLREEAANGRVSIPAFFIRRVFRIAPVYFFLLIIFGAQSYYIGRAYWTMFVDALPYYVSLMNEYRFGNWGPTWTLGIEWKFYLAWPVLAFALPLRVTMRILLASACVALMFLNWHVPWLFAYHYTVLLWGALLALVLNTRTGFAIFQPFMTPIGALVATALLVCTQAVSFPLNVKLGDASMGAVYGLIFVPFLVASLAATPLRTVLSHPALSFIGQRSYSIYLVQVMAHQAVSGVFLGAKASSITMLLTAAMAVIFADRLYQWVEKPMINVGRRLVEKLRSHGAHVAKPFPSAVGVVANEA